MNRPVYPPPGHNGTKPRKRRHLRAVHANVELPQRYDPGHVEFLRNQGCEMERAFAAHICRGPLEVHHFPRGSNKDDRMALCLCHGAHQVEIHNGPGHPSEFKTDDEWHLWEKRRQQQLLLQRLDDL